MGQGLPLPDVTRERLRVFVDAHGDYEAANLLGVGHPTLARALAGLRLKRGSATAIERGLDALATASAA